MLPPNGSVPQQQVQGGVPASPQAPSGAVPQAPQQGQSKPSSSDIELFRSSPEIKQAISLFVGKEVPMETVPDEILKEVAGMVAKLGVQGAVAMAEKMIPLEIKQQLKQGSLQGH